MSTNKARGFRATMAVVDPNIGDGRRRENLTLVFKTRISLDNRDGKVTRRMLFQVHMPHKSISATSPPKTHLQRPVTRSQHHLSPPPPLFISLHKPLVKSFYLSPPLKKNLPLSQQFSINGGEDCIVFCNIFFRFCL